MTSIVLSKHFFLIAGLSLILVTYLFQQTNWMKIKGFFIILSICKILQKLP